MSLNEKNLQVEIVNFIRSNVKSGSYHNTTETKTGDGSTKSFALTIYPSCINSVKIDGSSQSWGDYTFDFSSKTITFTTAPSSGANIVIDYDYYGTGALSDTAEAWVFWGYPSLGLQPKDYPRAGMIWLSVSREMNGAGYEGTLGERVLRVWVYSDSNDEVRSKLKDIMDVFQTRTWYFDGKNIRAVVVAGPTEPSLDPRRKGRYFGGFIDVMFPLIYNAV